jgi:hypothetical protein
MGSLLILRSKGRGFTAVLKRILNPKNVEGQGKAASD